MKACIGELVESPSLETEIRQLSMFLKLDMQKHIFV